MDTFHFAGFDPVESVKRKAEQVYRNIANAAPGDAWITAVLEYDGSYRCSVEVSSREWPAAVSVVHDLPTAALDKAENALLRKLTGRNDRRLSLLSGRARALADASA